MLFVQVAGGRPKLLRRAIRRERWQGGCIGGYRGLRICQQPAFFVSKSTNDLLMAVRRWWLVSADSVANGRRAVMYFDMGQPSTYGRVLASWPGTAP